MCLQCGGSCHEEEKRANVLCLSYSVCHALLNTHANKHTHVKNYTQYTQQHTQHIFALFSRLIARSYNEKGNKTKQNLLPSGIVNLIISKLTPHTTHTRTQSTQCSALLEQSQRTSTHVLAQSFSWRIFLQWNDLYALYICQNHRGCIAESADDLVLLCKMRSVYWGDVWMWQRDRATPSLNFLFLEWNERRFNLCSPPQLHICERERDEREWWSISCGVDGFLSCLWGNYRIILVDREIRNPLCVLISRSG